MYFMNNSVTSILFICSIISASFLSVARIQSHDMVEFNVIDFISCLSLESLIDQVVFTIGYPQLLPVKD